MPKTKTRSKHIVKRTTASRKRIVRHRKLHKRIFLHPLMNLFLMCVGVVLVSSTLMHSNAANTTISATVEAPELTDPAVITSPPDGTIFSSTPITVQGTCPDNSYVTLTRNGQFSGVDICTNNVFQIQTDLFSGGNQLVVQDYNTTNEAGPQSLSVNVTYNPPVVTNVNSNSPSSNSSSTSTKSTTPPSVIPLLVNSQFQYQAITIGQLFSWNINITGGTSPI